MNPGTPGPTSSPTCSMVVSLVLAVAMLGCASTPREATVDLPAQSVDWPKTLLLMDASIQAYRAFSPDPDPAVAPPGYEIVDTWTGVDSVFGHHRTKEIFGIVFRSVAEPSRYVFAFRGTDSVMDMLEDLGAEHRHFTPYEHGMAVPKGVLVEAGFHSVYTESDGKTHSMQRQLFEMLDRYAADAVPIEELWITGHSLGSSLSELFTLDVALSRPGLRASNINFACPRVGNQAFVDFYGRQAAQQNPGLRTIRVQNVFDRVPCLPPEDLDYAHVPNRFLIAFFKDSRWGIDPEFVLHNHASANYQAVLECASTSEDRVCVREALHVKGDGYTLTSERPDPDDICSFCGFWCCW